MLLTYLSSKRHASAQPPELCMLSLLFMTLFSPFSWVRRMCDLWLWWEVSSTCQKCLRSVKQACVTALFRWLSPICYSYFHRGICIKIWHKRHEERFFADRASTEHLQKAAAGGCSLCSEVGVGKFRFRCYVMTLATIKRWSGRGRCYCLYLHVSGYYTSDREDDGEDTYSGSPKGLMGENGLERDTM